MTEPRFDQLIHPSTRLSLMATLAAADWVSFAFLKDKLQMSDSSLSKQVSMLQDAGYLCAERAATGRRRTVQVRLTEAGRDAFTGHIAALRSIVADSIPAGDLPG